MTPSLTPEIEALIKKRDKLKAELAGVEVELNQKHWVKVSTDWVETATQPMTDFEQR